MCGSEKRKSNLCIRDFENPLHRTTQYSIFIQKKTRVRSGYKYTIGVCVCCMSVNKGARHEYMDSFHSNAPTAVMAIFGRKTRANLQLNYKIHNNVSTVCCCFFSSNTSHHHKYYEH